ncbi:MAG: imidazolonepropionase-like amidohydrolase, partial [Polaribacter sp.]
MKKIILTLIAVFLLHNITAQTTYILCGKLIDTKSGKITSKKTIVVKENKIFKVMDGYILPKSAAASTINLKDKVVIPGLIDFHVHIEKEFDRNTRLN